MRWKEKGRGGESGRSGMEYYLDVISIERTVRNTICNSSGDKRSGTITVFKVSVKKQSS